MTDTLAAPPTSRLRSLTGRVAELEREIRLVATIRPTPPRAGDAGLSPAERIGRVLDPEGPWFEIGALRAHDRYDGTVPAAGLITGLGTVEGRPVVVAASLPSVGGGAWWPETVEKLLRAQEVAARQRLPIVYLLEGGHAAQALVDGQFPGHYGPGRLLALASAMRRSGRAVQIAARLGALGGAAALLAELADVSVAADETGLAAVRAELATHPELSRLVSRVRPARPAAVPSAELETLLPADHRRSYDMHAVLRSLLDGGELDELQPRYAAEMICGTGWIEGRPVAVLANRRGVIPPTRGGQPRLGGIIYTESAAKMAYCIETASRQGIPILFVHDVSGFMLGVDAERSGIIRTGAGLVEAMATARSARIALTINHASGAGYYAMASQGFEPDFTLSWPTGRIGAMEAEAAITAAHGTTLARHGGREAAAPPEVRASIAAMRTSFERELDAVHAAAGGHVDAIVTPEATRATLAFLLRATARPAAT